MRLYSKLLLAIYAKIYQLHEAEINLISHLPLHLRKWRPDWPVNYMVGLDIGANLGTYAFLMSRYCMQVFAFEPNETVLRFLREAKLPNCKIINAAASDKAGQGNLVDESTKGWRRPTAKLGDQSEQPNNWSVPCDLVTVDSVLEAADFQPHLQVLVIKIDVESHELAVLNGMIKTMKWKYIMLVVELEDKGNQQHIEVLSLLKSHGFDGFVFRSGNLEPFEISDIPMTKYFSNLRFARLRGVRNNFVFLKK